MQPISVFIALKSLLGALSVPPKERLYRKKGRERLVSILSQETLRTIREYMHSLEGKYGVVSMSEALRYVHTCLGESIITDQVLTELIGREALQQGLAIHFDSQAENLVQKGTKAA